MYNGSFGACSLRAAGTLRYEALVAIIMSFGDLRSSFPKL
jgi:hypothetical protein